MKLFFIIVPVVVFAWIALPAHADVKLNLEPVRGDDGEMYYHALNDAGFGNPMAQQVLVQLETSRANLRKPYSITLFHAVGEYSQSSMMALFDVARTGQQYVVIQPTSPLAMKADWWVYVEGEEPVPTVKRLCLRNGLRGVHTDPYESGISTTSPTGSVVRTEGCYVVQPYRLVGVPAERVFHRLPIVRKRYHLGLRPARDHWPDGLRPGNDGVKSPAARNHRGREARDP